VHILDITSIPYQTNVQAPTSRYSILSPNESLLALVKDEQIVSKSVPWKVSIMPQWNDLASKRIWRFCKYSHEQLRRWYKYLQIQHLSTPSSNVDVVADISQDIIEEVETQAELEIIEDLLTSLPFVDSNSLQVPTLESIHEPLLCSQLPSHKDID